MRQFSEYASNAWNNLSEEGRESHAKQISGYVDNIMATVSADFQDLGAWKIPALGALPAEMLFSELRNRGCELRQGQSSSGWEVRIKPKKQ